MGIADIRNLRTNFCRIGLRFKFLFIVINDKPRQNSVTRLQVKNSLEHRFKFLT